MKIRLKKIANARPVISAIRSDGSVTSSRLGADGFGPVHDLAHYAVETELALAKGFYGLIAQGWTIPDFEVRGAPASFPDEAIVVECIVGQLTTVFFSAQPVSLADFNWLVGQAVAGVRPGATAPVLDPCQFDRLQERFTALVTQWRLLRDGETLELDFPPTGLTPAAAR